MTFTRALSAIQNFKVAHVEFGIALSSDANPAISNSPLTPIGVLDSLNSRYYVAVSGVKQ
jgi:hypothetical protein